jgi:orotidine-5'-phosphate decarboxylase
LRKKIENPLIIALDVASEKEVRKLCSELVDHVGMFKIGLQLFSSLGPKAISLVKDYEKGIFLDLKLHDIPATVEKTVHELAQNDVDLINVHALGGEEMMKAALKGIDEAREENGHKPKLIAVTVLTSQTDEQLSRLGFAMNSKDIVENLALLAKKTGLDGVVASPLDVKIVRAVCDADFTIICPGIRLAADEMNDQQRVSTPKNALDNGADYIVVGRPITMSKSPIEAAKRYLNEMELI